MTKRKFSKRAFKVWLDILCSVVVKTRDNFTCCKCGKVITDIYDCQWCHIKSRNSNSLRWDLLNSMTLDGACHQFAHANPDEAWTWLPQYQLDYLIEKQQEPLKTWREQDFLEIEAMLLRKAVDLKVDYMKMPKKYRKRLIRKMTEVE